MRLETIIVREIINLQNIAFVSSCSNLFKINIIWNEKANFYWATCKWQITRTIRTVHLLASSFMTLTRIIFWVSHPDWTAMIAIQIVCGLLERLKYFSEYFYVFGIPQMSQLPAHDQTFCNVRIQHLMTSLLPHCAISLGKSLIKSFWFLELAEILF